MSKKQISISYWMLGMLILAVSFLSLTGHVQQVISFQDPLNEILFFIFSTMLGIILIIGGFVDSKNTK